MVSNKLAYSLQLGAGKWYQGLDPEDLDPKRVESAIEDACTRIDEWDYDKDAHGYCHERTDWIALVAEIYRLRRLVKRPWYKRWPRSR